MHFQNRHSKYVLAKYGKTAIFVTVYITLRHTVCVRARGSENLCVRDEDKESLAHLILSWHGGWFCIGHLKRPCTKTDRQTERERSTDREGERVGKSTAPWRTGQRVSCSDAPLTHLSRAKQRGSGQSPAMDSLGGLLLQIWVLLYGSFGVLALLPGITEPEFIRRCVQAHNTQRSRVTPPAASARSMVRQVFRAQVFDASVMFCLDSSMIPQKHVCVYNYLRSFLSMLFTQSCLLMFIIICLCLCVKSNVPVFYILNAHNCTDSSCYPNSMSFCFCLRVFGLRI